MGGGGWVVHLSAGPQGGQKRAAGPETRAIGSCEPSKVGVGIELWSSAGASAPKR